MKEMRRIIPTGYADLLRDLISGSLAVNQELVLLYWRIGA